MDWVLGAGPFALGSDRAAYFGPRRLTDLSGGFFRQAVHASFGEGDPSQSLLLSIPRPRRWLECLIVTAPCRSALQGSIVLL